MRNLQHSTADLADLLQDHVAIDSVVPDEQEYGRFIETQLEEIGISTRRQSVGSGRFNVIATQEASGPTIGFYGHLDTVPAAQDWQRDPWNPSVEEGRLYGLGACDMKAGNLAILETLRSIDDVSIEVAFGVDEEYMSKGSTALIDDDVFTEADIIIVPEPANRDTIGQIGLGRRGRISIDVTVHGQAAHAATPEAGESAIQHAVSFIQELNAIELGTDPAMGRADLTIRSIEADAASLSLPDTASMIIDRHMVPGESIDHCLAQVRDAADRAGIEADVSLRDRPTPYLEPYKTEKEGIVQRFFDTVADHHGAVDQHYGDSVADENRLAEQDVPVITAGPIGDNIHQGSEWVDLDSIRTLIEIYQDFLTRVDAVTFD